MSEAIEGKIAALAAKAETQQQLIDAQIVIIGEMAEHLAILRTGIIYMMMQASMDEVDQTLEGNPWKKLKQDFVALLNPHIRALNKLLGIEVPDREPAKSVVVATK